MTRIKLIATVALGALFLISIMVNAWLFSVVEDKNTELGSLNSQLILTASANQSMTETVDRAERDKLFAQQAADEMKVQLSKRTAKTKQVVTVIQEGIKHEKCADVPIPDSIDWVYYH
ncbi:hypothetical protein [Vibrio sp. 10N.261.55.A7]|uniref:hypothetical protein n=1 Tax=Vibrio sp. 10N.261.55.A7 TaxID=1880851 RepID=UPI000C83F1DF|nr:hypothetical protein [Vibrio sp. 10N.261.55.A7]PMJ90282.1 hypothetical protein BCU12_12370 [Vibrio sp. 10N.261.55.A7]